MRGASRCVSRIARWREMWNREWRAVLPHSVSARGRSLGGVVLEVGVVVVDENSGAKKKKRLECDLNTRATRQLDLKKPR